MSVYVEDAPRVNPEIFELGVPVLGICYGAQGVALELGGTVARTGLSEFGKTTLNVLEQGLILDSMRKEEQCWMSHRDSITEPPPGFEVLAATQGAPVAAMEDRERGFYAVQFHPEVVHTPKGMDVLRSFLYKACGCAPTFTPESIIEESIRKIREQVGESKAILGLSGGVDSSVAALLMHRVVAVRCTSDICTMRSSHRMRSFLRSPSNSSFGSSSRIAPIFASASSNRPLRNSSTASRYLE